MSDSLLNALIGSPQAVTQPRADAELEAQRTALVNWWNHWRNRQMDDMTQRHFDAAEAGFQAGHAHALADGEPDLTAAYMAGVERGKDIGRAQALAEVAAAVQAERESCARLVEDQCGAWDEQGQVLVRMIRARFQPTAPEGGESTTTGGGA